MSAKCQVEPMYIPVEGLVYRESYKEIFLCRV